MLFFYLPWVEVSWHTEQGLGGWCEEAEVVFCIHGDVRGSHVQVFVLGGKEGEIITNTVLLQGIKWDGFTQL